MTIIIKADGTIKFLESKEINLDGIGAQTRCRASRIMPYHPAKWIAFDLLRYLFGETGRVAAWTRTWKGPWIAILLPPYTGSSADNSFVSMSRQDCLSWEREQLEEQL